MQGNVTIAVLADIHYGESSGITRRRCEIADILLRRAVHRLNRLIHPDVTVILGDVLDNGNGPNTWQYLEQIHSILELLESDYLIIPGNHDPDQETFYQVFNRPDAIEDVCGVRFLPFLDQDEPGYNARRSAVDIERFYQARNGYRGPIVSLQHVCLAPSGDQEIPYNYTNRHEIIDAMTDTGVVLSLSAHYHKGLQDISHGPTTFVNAPGLCEAPFSFLVVTLEQGRVSTEKQQLAMDYFE